MNRLGHQHCEAVIASLESQLAVATTELTRLRLQAEECAARAWRLELDCAAREAGRRILEKVEVGA